MVDISEFGMQLVDVLSKKGIDYNELPERPLSPPFISREELPSGLTDKISSVMGELQQSGKVMPLVHVTSRAIELNDGTVAPTAFTEQIMNEGVRVNTNIAAFVQRSEGELAKLATPEYFSSHPDQFIQDIYLMLKRYVHHGIRTNKDSLKHIRHKEKGLPSAVLIDGTGSILKRGVDGDDHYVIQQKIRPQQIMGVINVDELDLTSKKDIISYASQVLDRVDHYIERGDYKKITEEN